MKRAWQIAGIVLGMLAVLLGFIATQAPWATASESTGDTVYHAFSVAVDGPAQLTLYVKWSDPTFDGRDGIDMLRLAGPLFASSLGFALLSVIALEHALWFKVPGTGLAAALSGGAGALLAVVGVILMSNGFAQTLDWDIRNGFTESGTTLDLGGGFVVGLLAAVFAVGACAMAIVAAVAKDE
ncbi:MAG: hypothetical protein ACPHID_04835 [Thermoplasmatota archaeon]